MQDMKDFLENLKSLPRCVQVLLVLGFFIVAVLSTINPLEQFGKLPFRIQIALLLLLLITIVLLVVNPAAGIAVNSVWHNLKELL